MSTQVLAQVLVVAKAPVPGRAKTRLAATVGAERAAELAAASLLDTIRTCTAAFGAEHSRLALAGDLRGATYADRLAAALDGWRVLPQRGEGLARRLANAHLDVAAGGPVVQIGMDTPQVTAADLDLLAHDVAGNDAVLAPAVDGGWWALALADPRHGSHLADVPMSTPTTGADTCRALVGAGLRVVSGAVLRDVDTAEDADEVAEQCAAGSEFARLWRRSP